MVLNPYQKYQQQSVMTMTQGEMLTKLYDEIIKQLSAAKEFIAQENPEEVNKALQKAQRILAHLQVTLDNKYEVSESLNALYDYFIWRIIDANLHKEVAPIEEVLPMITDLRDTFIKADRTARCG
ncbi:MAG: flagellar secretion chaperone FliS [Clostridiales bacterium]|jgi:flagellar protein FliS|nr:flagellar secretion chaperone FliS [Clostridiales bacterium]